MLSGNDVQNAAIQAAELQFNTIGNTLGIHKPFEPEDHDLDPLFKLTKFSEIKAKGFKVPQDTLTGLLKGLKMGNQATNNFISEKASTSNSISPVNINVHSNSFPKSGYLKMYSNLNHLPMKRIEIGIDCCIIPFKNSTLALIQTTNNLYAIIDDPYVMGKIACSHILNNFYALGITKCDNMLMLLNISYKMTDKERDIVVPIMIRGFRDCALESGTTITGGHTMFNPWLGIGGVASTILNRNEYIIPENAISGDVLVLTKPIGTQIALIAYQWLDNLEKWNRIKLVVNDDEVRKAYLRAIDSMSRLNIIAAKLMHKFNAHAATDIGGFGLLGHADSLAKNQKNEVSFVLHNLPVISKLQSISKACGNTFSLSQGYCPETSGGLLISFPREQAAAFCKEIEKQEGYPAWIVGIVEKGGRTARIIDKPRIIEIPSKDNDTELW